MASGGPTPQPARQASKPVSEPLVRPAPALVEAAHVAPPMFTFPVGTAMAGRTLTLEDWRRAVVMQEVLSPPVSLRER